MQDNAAFDSHAVVASFNHEPKKGPSIFSHFPAERDTPVSRVYPLRHRGIKAWNGERRAGEKKRERTKKKGDKKHENWLNHSAVCRLRLTLEWVWKRGVAFFDGASSLFNRMSRVFTFSSRDLSQQLLHVFIVPRIRRAPTYYILLPRRICKTESPFKRIPMSGVTEGETDAISRVQ